MFITHFYLHDDWVEERDDTGRPVRTSDELLVHHDSARRVLRGGLPLPGDLPQVHLLYYFRRQVIEVSPHQDIRSLVQSVEQYLQAQVWEQDVLRRGGVPSLSAYMPMRLYSVGTLPFFELDLHLYGLAVPDGVREHPVVKRLCEMAVNHTIWTNDLHSVNKELRDGNTINLVAVLREERACGWQEAAQAAADMIHQETAAYLDLKERLPAMGIDARGDLGTWLSRMEQLMATNLAHVCPMPRYGAQQ
ncbi:terpene synthase family protein [Streptomyces sp. NPDC127051]|uniref:terpene synthase family protein n=1 Tax=Streptomyces sp. NPDC127051 TaxID=3347119 RepID=UPI003667F63E